MTVSQPPAIRGCSGKQISPPASTSTGQLLLFMLCCRYLKQPASGWRDHEQTELRVLRGRQSLQVGPQKNKTQLKPVSIPVQGTLLLRFFVES